MSLNLITSEVRLKEYTRERPDTIRCIVSNLVGDDDSGESLVDESEPIQPLHQTELEEYNDPNWEPEPVDAGPGRSYLCYVFHGLM